MVCFLCLVLSLFTSNVWSFASCVARPKVLASAFSTEMGRLRDAGSAAAEAQAAAAAAAGGEDGMVLDGASEVKTEVRRRFRVSFCVFL